MSKLTKAETRRHAEAVELLKKDNLKEHEALKVFENWHPGAEHMNAQAGAFFTPTGLANDFCIEVAGRRIVDLCAGIGVLSFMATEHFTYGGDTPREFVCIERNPAYVEVGKKLVPHATWICGDVTDPDLWAEIGHFDCAISNPPFGNVKTGGHKAPRYTGAEFELKAVDIASDHADQGVFIIPQASTPFRYSGSQLYQETNPAKYAKFSKQTGIRFDFNCGIDTAFHKDDWLGVSPLVEVVNADFIEARASRAPVQATIAALPSHNERALVQGDLFAA